MIEEYFPANFNKLKEIKGNYQGWAVANLSIDHTGKITNIQLIKNPSPEIDKEILRLLSKTKWEPAINNFAPVNYDLVLNVWIANQDPNYYQVTCAPAVFRNAVLGYHEADSLGKVFPKVETEPEFPGGIKAFMEYFNNNVRYPEKARKNDKQGIVFATFIVEKDGSLSNFLISRSPDEDLSLEALRILKQCPKFSPGVQNGELVRVQYTIPLFFKLPN